MIRRGTLAGYGFREGLIPGSEIAGTVAAVGQVADFGTGLRSRGPPGSVLSRRNAPRHSSATAP